MRGEQCSESSGEDLSVPRVVLSGGEVLTGGPDDLEVTGARSVSGGKTGKNATTSGEMSLSKRAPRE